MQTVHVHLILPEVGEMYVVRDFYGNCQHTFDIYLQTYYIKSKVKFIYLLRQISNMMFPSTCIINWLIDDSLRCITGIC